MQSFPDIGETQALIEMQNSQNQFARLTGVLQKIGALAGLTLNVSWNLPSDFVELYEVELYDTDS